MEAVVVDPGSKLLKAGYAVPDQEPSLIIPTKMKCVPEDGQPADTLAYDDVTVDPVIRGFIKDWDAMEDLLRYVLYTGLEWEEGNEGQILFTDPLATPKVVREKLIQMMFETFNVSGFYASEQAVLSLYAVGRISGCSVDVGHGKIDIAPVCEGAVQYIASKRFEIGGVDLTRLFAQELQQSNPLSIDIFEIEKLKEQYACCAEDHISYKEKQKTCQPEKHTLPDGQEIIIGKERYTIGEALFQPSILGLEEYGIVEQLVRCVTSVPYENQRMLLENTVVCGGTTSMTEQWENYKILLGEDVHVTDRQDINLPGFEDRFQREACLCSSAIRPVLVKPPEYMPENLLKNSAWMGGAILAKVVFPQNQHVTKGDYDETGPSIVHRKCF